MSDAISISAEWANVLVSLVSGFVGVALGGYISFKSTKYFFEKEENDRRKAAATSLAFRLLVVSSDILGIKREIDAMLAKKGGREAIEYDQYWACVVQILGAPTQISEIESTELALFPEKDEADFVMQILDTTNLRNILVQAIAHYNTMREVLADELEHISEFSESGAGLSATVSFNGIERPDLVRRIGEVNNLVHQIIEMTDVGKADVTELIEQFNSRAPKKFGDGEFNFRLGSPSSGSRNG